MVLLSGCYDVTEVKTTEVGRRQWHATYVKCLENPSVDLLILIGCIPLCRCATSRTVPGSIPGGVTGDFFSIVPSDKTMCPEVDSVSENEYQEFLMG